MARHHQIFETLKREILAGRFDDVQALPSETKLAERFEVSRPTVSRVILDLKRAGLVVTRAGAATRLSKFALNSSGTIGIVDPGRGFGGVISDVCGRIEELAQKAGWKVIRETIAGTSPSVRAREARRIVRLFGRERVAGVFMQPLEYQDDNASANRTVLDQFDRKDLPIVLLDYDVLPSPKRSKYDLVGIDNFSAGVAVGSRLVAEGCRSVGFLLPPGAAPTIVSRMRGVSCAVIESGGRWTFRGNVLQAKIDDRNAIRRFLSKARIDALVCGNDATAALVKKALGEGNGIRIAGFDDTDDASAFGLLTVRQPRCEMAMVALSTLLTRIKNPRLPPRTIMLAAEAVDHARRG